ncbi:MAG: SDR family oxidoreductase [Acidimicrobiaceae bacterium]|nr:SDR family oxidoreductase [Acidimicrobiaceae bacterium]
MALGLMDNTAGGDYTEDLARGIPVERLGTPADIGAICVYLASKEASWTTGQTINGLVAFEVGVGGVRVRA